MKVPTVFGELPHDAFDSEYLRLIESDLAEAQANLDALPINDRRGLALDTLRHFHCGFLPDWVLTKSRAEYTCGIYVKELTGEVKHLPPPSPRIIIPTAGGHHFNAVAIPSARSSMDKAFWKQHAGTMELFADSSAFNSDVIIVFEGELNVMSVWQASNSHAAAVAILGCNNWKKTLLPKLPDLNGKKFLLLFDADKAGKKNATKLRDELLQRGFPAVSKFLFDFLPKDEQNFFGSKVDANDILKARGNDYLNSLIDKILSKVSADFDSLFEQIQQQNVFNHQQNNPLPTKFNLLDGDKNAVEPSDDVAQKIIEDALKFIPAKELSRDDWFDVASVLKRYGFSLDVFTQWSNDGDPRFNSDSCRVQWDSIKSADELNGKGCKIGTIIRLAKQFGYKSQLHDTSLISSPKTSTDEDPNIVQWQLVNGSIDPDLLGKLKLYADRIKNSSDLVAISRDTSSLRFLGAFLYYSFFADITHDFFAKLSDAHRTAKAKVNKANVTAANSELYQQVVGDKAIANDSSSIDDSTAALAALSIQPVKNDVAKFKTAAARDHKRYLVQKEIDDRKAKYEAEHIAYEDKPNTTKRLVHDCPVDLVLPYGVFLDDSNGVRIVDFEKNLLKGHPVVAACQNPIVPVCVYRDTDKNFKNFTQYEIAIKTDDNTWQFITCDGRTLQDPRAISELSNFGAHILNHRVLAQYFAKLIALNERNGRLKTIRIFKQPGWHGDEFIWPTGGDDYIVKNGNFDYEGIFSPSGNIDKAKRMFHRALFHDPKNYSPKSISYTDSNGVSTSYSPDSNPFNISSKPNVVFALTFGFVLSSPLLKPLGLRNQQMILGFDSGHGKTAAAKLAVSFFGRPDKGLAPSLNATQNFLEDLSIKLNDFPHVVDELQSVKKKFRDDMDDWLYNFSFGTSRGRADIKGKALPTYDYRGVRLFTGEQDFVKNNSGQGAISRIFEIKKSDLFADPFAVEIHNFVLDNYASFGKRFITEFIPNNLDRFREYFENLRDTFAYSESLDLLSSHATVLALSISSLRFALEFLGYQNTDQIILDLLDELQELIDDAPSKASSSNVERAVPDLLDFFHSHAANFIEERSNSSSDLTAFAPADNKNEVLGVKLLDGRIAVYPLALRNTLNQLGFPSASALIRGFAKAGYLEGHNSRTRAFQSRLPSHFARWFGKSPFFYIFKPLEDHIAA